MAKSPVKYEAPAIFSFFIPGLGQLVKGQLIKGVVVFFVWMFSFILVITIIGILAPLVIWIWNIYDAYNSPAVK